MKNKLQRFKIAKRIILFAFALTLSNCQVEEEQTQQESRIKTVSTNEAKDFLAQAKVNSKSKSSKTERENIDFKKITQEKINGSDQLLTVIPFATTNEVRNDRVLLMKIGGEIKSVIFSMQPEENSVKGSFSGKIFIYSLDGFFLNGYRAKNGIIISQFIKTTKASLTSKQDGEALKEVIVTNNYHGVAFVNYFYFETIWGSGGSSDAGGGQGMSWDAGMGDGGSGITAPTPLQIIDELIGKSKCLNALLNKNGDSFVQKLLANFQGKSEFDIKIVSVDKIYAKDANGNFIKDANGNLLQSNGVTTYTREINKSLINIAISTSRANDNSSLDVARTILHEYIHADIIRKLYTENNISGPLDFNLIYQKYGSQHGTMAALYLSSMKEALKEFNKTVLPNDYKNYTDYYGEEPSDAFYEALAWSGLKENNVQAWTNLTAQQQQDINNLAARVTKMSKTVNCPQ